MLKNELKVFKTRVNRPRDDDVPNGFCLRLARSRAGISYKHTSAPPAAHGNVVLVLGRLVQKPCHRRFHRVVPRRRKKLAVPFADGSADCPNESWKNTALPRSAGSGMMFASSLVADQVG